MPQEVEGGGLEGVREVEGWVSRPRYAWWGYVKYMIRQYPIAGDEATGVAARERDAVRRAITQTERMADGRHRLGVIDMVFWRRTHTLEGAALQTPCSIRTAQEYHRQFIRTVAREFGLLD